MRVKNQPIVSIPQKEGGGTRSFPLGNELCPIPIHARWSIFMSNIFENNCEIDCEGDFRKGVELPRNGKYIKYL
jgi:hypothetical protein